MTSDRLKHVYRTKRWQELRREVIARAGGQCQQLVWSEFARGWTRCSVRDRNYGGTESLTVDHINDQADPYDDRFLRALCFRHHGKKDGGKRVRRVRRFR